MRNTGMRLLIAATILLVVIPLLKGIATARDNRAASAPQTLSAVAPAPETDRSRSPRLFGHTPSLVGTWECQDSRIDLRSDGSVVDTFGRVGVWHQEGDTILFRMSGEGFDQRFPFRWYGERLQLSPRMVKGLPQWLEYTRVR